MAKKNEALEGEDHYDMTSMIDVVFLLLVYFMFLPLQQESDLGITLPADAPPSKNLDLPSEHIVQILPNGNVLLNGAPMDNPYSRDMPSLASTLARLKVSADRTQTKTVVTIQADQYSPHQRSIDVLNACARAKIKSISFGG
jgi:biopolymer transport protein ExbD|tara:strand:+ start:748 stop:1173 length:426 start_codon:yes stop_codon:yes gene_type:complete